MQRPEFVASGDRLIGAGCGSSSVVDPFDDHSIQLTVETLIASDRCIEQLTGTEFAGSDQTSLFVGWQQCDVHPEKLPAALRGKPRAMMER